MRVTIPDTLADQLTEQLPGRRTLDEEIAGRLRLTLRAAQPQLVLGREDLATLSEALGTDLAITSVDRLHQLCAQLAQVHLGHVRLQWSPEQLRLLQDRAARSSLSVAQLVVHIASRVMQDVFLLPPPAEPPVIVERLVLPAEATPADRRKASGAA